MTVHSVFLFLAYVWYIFMTVVNSSDLKEDESVSTSSDDTMPEFLSDPANHCHLPANPKEFPFMALIGYGDRRNVSWECSGTLISSRYVLSAAYCSDTYLVKRPSNWIRLGDLDISTVTDDARPSDYSIIEIIKHPDYAAPQYYNDIVLYKLDREVLFNEYIKPVCLQRNEITTETDGTVTGWGIEETGPVTSPYLLKADVLVLSNQNCSSTLHYEVNELKQGIDWRSQVCTTMKNQKRKSCLGDVGGPLLVAGDESCEVIQIGITSKAIYCGNYPCGISTKISYFVPWIETIVKLD